MNNKLIRLAELVQEDFPENLLTAFKSPANTTLAQRLGIASQAIASHQKRAEDLWLKAGRKRSPRERQASARAELAAFLFACLSGDAPEYADSAREALRALGRQGETGLVNSLCRK